MALSASFIWKNPDATKDLNARLKKVVNRGIVWGGDILPGAGLTVQVSPFVAVGFDGMTVADTVPQTLAVAASTKNYVVVRARYNEGGVPATPTLAWQVLPEAAYLIDAEKDYLIVFGVVDLGAVISVTLNDIIYATYRDAVDPLGRSWYRGTVNSVAQLPVPPPHVNWVGDFYWVQNPPGDNTLHFWGGSTWEPLNTGSYNSETTLMNRFLVDSERDRIVNGSGVIAGRRPNGYGLSADNELSLDDGVSITDFEVGIDTFSAVVNGHFVEAHARNVTLTAPPVAPFRYDLVFLEVWREDITIPETQTYARNPDGSSTYNIDEVDTQVEEILVTPGVAGNNFDLNVVETDNHLWRVTKWRLGVVNDVPQIALAFPNHPSVVTLATNVDGINFSTPPAGSGVDKRVWMATSVVTPADGKSWAIPLVVVRRISTEALPGNNVKIFRDGIRHVFPVYPDADRDKAARTYPLAKYEEESIFSPLSYKEPSGFTGGMGQPIETASGAPANTLRFSDKQLQFRIRGFEDSPAFPFGLDFGIGAPPGAGWGRTLIYLKMSYTFYDNSSAVGVNENYAISGKHRPIISMIGNNQGFKRGFIQYEMMYENLGSANVLDEHDAMMALSTTWVKGDLSVPSPERYNDGGIWSSASTLLGDDRVHVLGYEWAIPVCLVHRRNQAAWSFNSNPNGSGPTRPDARQDPNAIYPDDLVDLRHVVNLTASDCEALMKESLDKMMKGMLRTRMANKYQGSGSSGKVAGSRILQSDFIGTTASEYSMANPDGHRTIWSDAKEFALVALELDLAGAASSSDIHSWSLAGNIGTLTLKAPQGASIVRHIPSALHAVGDVGITDKLDFYGPPCWGTQWDDQVTVYNTAILAHAHALTYDPASHTTDGLQFFHYNTPGGSLVPQYAQPFKVNTGTLDNSGRATEMTGFVDTVSTPTDIALLSFWVHYDRTFTGDYADNYGLAEIPDVVHKATLDPSGVAEELHIGPLYAVITKTAVAASTIAITAADVTAATGTPGTVTLWGLDQGGASSEPYWEPELNTSFPYTRDIGGTTLTLQFNVPYSGEIRVKVYYSSDIDKWIEVGRGGKSVQAIFSWGSKEDIDFGVPVPPPGTDYTFGLGSSVWVTPPIGKNVPVTLPLVYTKVLVGDDWTLVGASPGFVRHPYSNAISLKPLTYLGTLLQFVMVVWPNQSPLAVGRKIQIDYTYTPYQGLSSPSGEVAVPATVLPELKEMLHGTVEGNTDFYITQSGATSAYSGVNTFTGKPVNHTSYLSGGIGGDVLGTDRLSVYNRTSLVGPPAPYGTGDLLAMSGEEKYSLNAAAVLRLPFPMHPNMLSPFVTQYHKGVMDFDLDPERAGAGAGFQQYAPGYPNSGYASTGSPKYRGDHFVNGLARLAASGDLSKQARNDVGTSEKFSNIAGTPFGEPFVEFWSSIIPGQQIYIQGNAPISGMFDTVLRTLTPYYSDRAIGGGSASGSHLYNLYTNETEAYTNATDVARYAITSTGVANDAEWTAIEVFTTSTPKDYILCVTPAVVTNWLKLTGGDLLVPKTVLYNNPSGGAVVAKIFATQYTIDSEDTEFMWGNSTPPIKTSVDLLIVPMESGQRNAVDDSYPILTEEANSITSLRGREINYPPDWSPATATKLESLLVASDNGRGAGRGIYLGDTTTRYNMPMLVPGTGTSLDALTEDQHLVLETPVSPPTYPTVPNRPVFDRSNITYVRSDIGGPIAYVCYGAVIRPSGNDYRNAAVMQISGGPTGGTSRAYTTQELDGQAIDAFWMPGRPILKAK